MYRRRNIVQLTEMEDKYLRFQRVHIQKYVDRYSENYHYLNTKK